MKTYMLKYIVPKSTGLNFPDRHQFMEKVDIYYRFINVTLRSTPGHAVRQSDLPAQFLVSIG